MNIRELERDSIRDFLTAHETLLTGRVLDLGCGKQPYRDIIERNCRTYHPWDHVDLPASVYDGDPMSLPSGKFDAIVSTQVLQYVVDVRSWLKLRHVDLDNGGHLLLTGPTNWPIVEVEDLWRWTPAGIATELQRAGFHPEKIRAGVRAAVVWPGQSEKWPLGWWAVAQKEDR